MELRDYQQAALRSLRERRIAGIRRLILQLPTGGGKTIIAVSLILSAVRQGKPVLFVAHRIDLINQAVDKLLAWGVPENQIGVIRSGDKRVRPTSPIQVASVQSLKHLPPARLVFIDEAHRCASKSYQKIFDGYPEATILGLTGTPERLDGRPLTMFEEILVIALPQALANEGYIAAPITHTVPRELMPELDGIDITAGDYDRKQLAVVVKERKLIGSIVDHWKQRAGGRSTIIAATDVEHSKMITNEFLHAGIAAAHIDGDASDKERSELRCAVEEGEILVVSQVDLWIEGLDLPRFKCGVFARPTRSLTIYLQFIGRILRPYHGITPLILDHAGNSLLHGPPLFAHKFSLKGRTKRPQGASITTMCTGPGCYLVVPASTRICPSCGTQLKESSEPKRIIQTEDGSLVELPPDPMVIRQQFWRRVTQEAEKLGYQIYWCRKQFHEKFGEWPPEGWIVATPEPSTVNDKIRREQLNKLRAMSQRNGLRDPWANARYYAMYRDTPEALLEREIQQQRTKNDPLEEYEV